MVKILLYSILIYIVIK